MARSDFWVCKKFSQKVDREESKGRSLSVWFGITKWCQILAFPSPARSRAVPESRQALTGQTCLVAPAGSHLDWATGLRSSGTGCSFASFHQLRVSRVTHRVSKRQGALLGSPSSVYKCSGLWLCSECLVSEHPASSLRASELLCICRNPH